MGRRKRMNELREAYTVAPQSMSKAVSSIEQAYVAYYPSVYRYTLALTRSREDAEDITGEVFARALRSWEHVPAQPLPWLLLTARRIGIDRARRATRMLRSWARMDRSEIETAGEEAAEFWEWFDAICRVLTSRQREALILRYERDLSDVEIGNVMGLTESGVRSLVSRALEALRAHPELL